MKKLLVCLGILSAAVLLLSTAATAADSIKNRLGITGRLGFIVPSNSSEVITGTIGTNADVIGGGSVIYGVTDHWAAEFDITHAGFGSNAGLDFGITDVSFGAQYRFLNLPYRQLTLYLGGGLAILVNDVSSGSVDDVAGVQVSGGADYFLMKQLAVNVEARGVIAPNADFRAPSGAKLGDFDPTSFSLLFGVRYFFN